MRPSETYPNISYLCIQLANKSVDELCDSTGPNSKDSYHTPKYAQTSREPLPHSSAESASKTDLYQPEPHALNGENKLNCAVMNNLII